MSLAPSSVFRPSGQSSLQGKGGETLRGVPPSCDFYCSPRRDGSQAPGGGYFHPEKDAEYPPQGEIFFEIVQIFIPPGGLRRHTGACYTALRSDENLSMHLIPLTRPAFWPFAGRELCFGKAGRAGRRFCPKTKATGPAAPPAIRSSTALSLPPNSGGSGATACAQILPGTFRTGRRGRCAPWRSAPARAFLRSSCVSWAAP